MGIAELKAMAGDNHEMSAEIDAIEATMTKNTGRIMDLETQNQTGIDNLNEAIMSRDKVRNVIKNELGIQEFTADAVRTKLSSYASDDAIAARDKQFTDLKAASATKIEDLQNQLSGKDNDMNTMRLKLAISKTDIMGQTRGEHASDMLLSWIAENAVFDESGNIEYKGTSGETLYNANANPLTLEDRINEIKSDSSRDFVFQSTFLAGGGAPTEKIVTGPAGGADGGGAYIRSKMNFDEQKSYRAKYGEAAYQKLPLI